jgi:hypothetical protein
VARFRQSTVFAPFAGYILLLGLFGAFATGSEAARPARAATNE